ncbi:MAG TPA: DUF3800 domain-containing protein [Pseudolabrys sp.]|uniref:DUF3800 domain-containing protein n=1 Tax=Pseudolabrys sp. TaxID=1960880 RepID=UPI002DDDACB3|nr:DUF3800 domain-containing protein [Pseudolabrys sp.]HEV2627102.1 DUF3800 domain-containing protein [Pseudolabrys sp.]
MLTPASLEVCADDAPFVRFLDVILPFGGHVTVQAESYFDESGSHDGAPVLCIAGYIFEKDKAARLTEQWRAVLAEHKIPYFRMSDCAHGNGPFKGMTKQHRLEIEMMMIGVIKRWSIQGIAATLDHRDYEAAALPKKSKYYGGPYTLLAHTIMVGVAEWIRHQTNAPVSSMAYFFESGHASQRESDAVMHRIFNQSRGNYRYAGHAFVPKENTPAVQAADLLAWQWYTDRRHQKEGKRRRKDCTILLEHHHNTAHLRPERLTEISEILKQFGLIAA